MSDHDLGRGFRIESLNITPSFPSGFGKATLKVPDDVFPEIKGTIQVSSGQNATAKTVGQAAMGATATFVAKGTGLEVGFKQLIFFKFQTALYAGLKDSDGSIEESSTGLNSRFFLDCSVDQNLNAPWAPFYLPVNIVRSGPPISIDMPDQPSARFRLQRRNSLRDRLNFLLSVRTSSEFVTFVVVKLPDNRHVPLEGFSWKYSHDVELQWTKGNPVISRDSSSIRFDSKIVGLTAGDNRFDMFANASLGSSDTMVLQFNKAMFAAGRGQPTAGYEIKEFADNGPNISENLRSRLVGAFT